MVPADVFRDRSVLHGEHVRLEPLGPAVLEDYLRALDDPEVRRSTGSHTVADRTTVERWLASRHEHHDRADWAVVRAADGAFLGEAVLNDLDPDNGSCNFRILLGGPHQGRGYGTEAVRLAVGEAFARGLHRVSLGVFEFNARAQRVYEKCGFVVEGRCRDVLHWDGRWHDEIVMSVLAGELRRPARRAGGALPARRSQVARGRGGGI
ncbi:GNAT family N-acetyltransferase [Pseudonocardia sp. S2-4]|uniref:GNAT family N-acetyltransferase n=1 Tax=Pseudonocardia humida TaxID=2800819 RepID=A0ABT1A0F9_9PSEU|nr:GNAT family N-acetyltransferase [Pseudonocardia humida]